VNSSVNGFPHSTYFQPGSKRIAKKYINGAISKIEDKRLRGEGTLPTLN